MSAVGQPLLMHAWRNAFAEFATPVGQHPEEYGVSLRSLPPVSFARNDVGFIDPSDVDHDILGLALNKALYNYMHGIGLDDDVRQWFTGKTPKTRVPRHFIERALNSSPA